MKRLLLDITGAKPGSEGTALQVIAQKFPEECRESFILFSDSQKVRIPPPWPTSRRLPDALQVVEIVGLVETEFVKPTLTTSLDTLTVVSFHKIVCDIEHAITDPEKRINFLQWAELLPDLTAAKQAAARRALAQLMPTDDALQALEVALSANRAVDLLHGVPLTSLRELVERADVRFKKKTSMAKTPGLMRALADLGEERGIIQSNRNTGTSHFLIWLKPYPKSDDHLPHEDVSRKSACLSRDVGLAVSMKHCPERMRSDVFVDTLSSQNFGPFSRIRRMLYEQLLIAVGDGSKTASDLLADVVKLTREAVEITHEGSKPIAWRKVKEFLRSILAREEVLLNSDKQPFALSFETGCVKITGLVPNFRVKLDGQLVLALLESNVALHLGDIANLAGALFNNRSATSEGEVAKIIDSLLRSGRVEAGPDRLLRLAKRSVTIAIAPTPIAGGTVKPQREASWS